MYTKNNDQSASLFREIEEGIFVLRKENESNDSQMVTQEIKQNFIQFHFCDKGAVTFVFHSGNYSMLLKEMESLLLYNPKEILPLQVRLAPGTTLFSIFITIGRFHSLFLGESGIIDFLSPMRQHEKYYTLVGISPQLFIILHQIRTMHLPASLYSLYLRAKIYELLSLYFNKGQETETEACPFLSSEENVQKIRQAKELLLRHMTSPPSLQELSEEVGLPLKKLKSGFKQIYGESVYGFLFDYKMELARKWLTTEQYNVNELSLKLGYSMPSHFIAAFKKKFGTTPKKYVLTKNTQ
ncbi:AraC family transcriptional regulator [Capnocytophaga sp. G2]|uniref:helix-turn-helix transcriptional regulator n=1 Tax=Capnocytophaga sp. G2 TaxID=3110695 RepID=UPI002B489939|nr:AraC family transcriptional regulator [Capnocytophaga sp. G2]MEB3004414.1 AraC family transcriptional regulator [Capnocytophaga sp. G2]